MKKTFFVKTPYITLGQLLKAEAIIGTGGQAKWYLRDHPVMINSKPDQRRGKKLRPGDTVEIPGKMTLFIRKKQA